MNEAIIIIVSARLGVNEVGGTNAVDILCGIANLTLLEANLFIAVVSDASFAELALLTAHVHFKFRYITDASALNNVTCKKSV